MSKSSFLLLLLLVASLAGAASLQSGGAWLGSAAGVRYEAREDIFALKDDLREIQAEMQSAPAMLRDLWDATCSEVKTLEADLKVDARSAARRFSAMIRTS